MVYHEILSNMSELTPEFLIEEGIETFQVSPHVINDSTGEMCYRIDYTLVNDDTEHFCLIF